MAAPFTLSHLIQWAAQKFQSREFKAEKKATKPADYTKTETETEAFVFAGWYTSTDRGTNLSDTAFNFDTAITDNITL